MPIVKKNMASFNPTVSKNSKSTKRLRSQTKIWLLNTTLEEFTGSKLPLNLLVLRRFMFIRDECPNSTTRSTAKAVFQELKSKFWGPSRIPLKHEKKSIDPMEGLFHSFEKLRKTPIERRAKAENSDRVRRFLDDMSL